MLQMRIFPGNSEFSRIGNQRKILWGNHIHNFRWTRSPGVPTRNRIVAEATVAAAR